MATTRTKRPRLDLVEVERFFVPRPVAARLDDSRVVLDEDEDGFVCDESTWRRAITLVARATAEYVAGSDREVYLPIISAGDDGSVDIQWRDSTRNVLINVPSDAEEEVRYYAHDRELPQRDIGAVLTENTSGAYLLFWLTA